MNTLTLSRAQHDAILADHPALLRKAFRECKAGRPFASGLYQWNINGVRFDALSDSTCAQLSQLKTSYTDTSDMI